jgi:hypothetical protein
MMVAPAGSAIDPITSPQTKDTRRNARLLLTLIFIPSSHNANFLVQLPVVDHSGPESLRQCPI